MSTPRVLLGLAQTRSKQQSAQLVQNRLMTTTPTGGVVEQPKKEPMGILNVGLTVFAGLGIGAAISKNMASFLEENELFVPADDDDDD